MHCEEVREAHYFQLQKNSKQIEKAQKIETLLRKNADEDLYDIKSRMLRLYPDPPAEIEVRLNQEKVTEI